MIDGRAGDKLRLDKWLWAARFFKTRSLAKAAIEGGKVHLGGQRVKVSKEISVGDTLQIRQGWDEKVVRGAGTERPAARRARGTTAVRGNRRKACAKREGRGGGPQSRRRHD